MSESTHQNKTILAFGPGLWREGNVSGSTRYHLWTLSQLGWTVIYVEPPTRFHLKRKTWKAPDRNFTVVSGARVPLFAVSKTPSPSIGKLMRRMTSKRLAKEALSACEDMNITPDVVWMGAPWQESLIEFLPAQCSIVHHVYDELASSPILSDAQRQLLNQWERDLWGKCDRIFCSSFPQFEKRRAVVGDQCVLAENSVPDDVLNDEMKVSEEDDFFQQFWAMPEPRFIYGGVIDLRMNPDFFLSILEKQKLGSLIFLGNLGAEVPAKLSALLKNERVLCTGAVPHRTLLKLYHHADVLLLGHQLNDFTRVMFPDKLLEYLASGKPIVSVKMPEVMRLAKESENSDIITFVENAEEAGDAISSALELDSAALQELRRELAATRTWSITAKKIEQELLGLIQD